MSKYLLTVNTKCKSLFHKYCKCGWCKKYNSDVCYVCQLERAIL